MRIWCRLKGLCINITVSAAEWNYSYYWCQYNHFEIHAWSMLNGVHDIYKGDTFYKYIWGLYKNKYLQIYDIFLFLNNKFDNEQLLKCNHTTAYGISVCERMLIRWYTLVVRYAYVVYVPNTLTYAGERCLIRRDQLIFWTCSKFISVYKCIEYTLLKRQPYARHTLDTLDIR